MIGDLGLTLHSAAKTGLPMNRFCAWTAGLLLSAAMLVSGSVQAMEIRQSDKVQLRDQGAYAVPLARRSENVSNSDGKGHVTNSTSKPMVTHNPDGTFTVQKESPNGSSKDPEVKGGLVIPPQVVVPFIRH